MDYIHMTYLFIPFLALLLDTLIGDPNSRWHPVVLMGNLIAFFEKVFYFSEDGKWLQRIYGTLTVLATLTIVIGMGICLELIGNTFGYIFKIIMNTFLLYICIAPRALATAAFSVSNLLRTKKLKEARKKVSYIVGRDTEYLEYKEVVRATIETVAESTIDGIISPLLFFAILGPVGALFYRAVNTMDSMLGHKNDKYRYFGTFAARLDDVCNFIPARITFLLIVVSSFLFKEDYKNAYKVGLRDSKKHPSPNGGYAEAPMAGALHIQLGGLNYYDNEPNFRAYMGEPDREMKAFHINKAVFIMYITTLLGCALATLIHYVFYGLI